MTGAFGISLTGAFLVAPTGARMMAPVRLARFAVFYIDQVKTSYYNYKEPDDSGPNRFMREQWLSDVRAYDEVALQITEADLWPWIALVLVQVENVAPDPVDPGPPWPRLAPPNPELYPDRINPFDKYQLHQHPNLLTLESLYSRMMADLALDRWPTVHWLHGWRHMGQAALEPGFSEFLETRQAAEIIQTPPDQRWVLWIVQFLESQLP
jgi:hypothetical protein